ncbi:MAG: hypothetical protein ABSA17_05070 [Rhabdochlamydiaceae bacterium]
MTYLDKDKIVRDRTVVFANQQWTFYDDDPTLSGPSYKSVEELVKSMGAMAKYPLMSTSAIQG